MNCQVYTNFAPETVMPGSTLFGVTNAMSNLTCAYGYTIGGGYSVAYDASFTCTGTAHSVAPVQATNQWLPDPSLEVNSCLRKLESSLLL